MYLKDIYQLILKDGLRQTKFKNSHMKLISSAEEKMKGSIFGFRSKANMVKARGLVLTSLEAVLENQANFTHWTPNVYCYGSYSDETRQITCGHSEDNLRQINTFVIDFDITSSAEEMTQGDILTAAIDLGFMPTLILKTDKGYQAYFVLSEAAYVTAHSHFKVVKVAKAISQNLRNHFNQTLPVDLTCNHFGIARMPRTDNIAFFHADYTYSFQEWLDWSMKQSGLPFPSKKPNLTVISGTEGIKQVDEPWYHMLLNESNIKGAKALMGRNNVLFTLALANFSSGVSQGDCEVVLNDFNLGLDEPITTSELLKLVSSAYSGKYEGASRDYITLLCRAWVDEKLKHTDLFTHQRWYKFKKKRSERQKSHLHEWKADVMAYLEKEGQDTHFLQTTKKAIHEAIGIPERSLVRVLNVLKAEGKIFYRVKRGRNGGLRLAAIVSIFQSVIRLKKERQEAYLASISGFFSEPLTLVKQTVLALETRLKKGQQLSLFERDIG
ncbi:TPA: primase C-terminal domain-containing protein [Streptococcus equi subsp. zooepidemicus]|uniref:primase C-terminal domain-containing protein n=1 Tax=Streptococcus equi TaxID=1336 RepID=UPI001E4E9CB3|nr:primase C-terminal domain-containing protein [Streptococcus equi]MCD3405691.1 primase C-terminal domain-containing protein [Streptococcus equi subsp. zooepidemicus]HEL0714309.1 primase C-terminal domain-containing protein [Streptococcus equi subsp. zooepidemicus]HEL1106720.1 primase C-terminal domain-containing protein [Streptococcus equi subsp. zooepidemicus]HEL1149239.1 primase C-terminal domain-containing protein [Streptococcus equi subsp. zooepidemicus]HEL1308704.1 primase C-terminal do